MKFQDTSFNGLKVTEVPKSVTHPHPHAPKAICLIIFFIQISTKNKNKYEIGGISKLHDICMDSKPKASSLICF